MASFSLFNDIKRIIRSSQLELEGATTIFGNAKLDLTQAPLAAGEHTLNIFSVFGNIKLRVPDHIGLDIDATTIFGELEVETITTGEEEKPGGSWVSENYHHAPIRLTIRAQSIFGDVDVMRVPVASKPAPVARLTTTNTPLEYSEAYEGQTINLDQN